VGRKPLRTIYRILIAFIGVLLLVIVILGIELLFGGQKICQPQETWILCQIRQSALLQAVQGFSILVAAVLFLLETSDRRKRSYYEAWKVIDAAHGRETSYARFQALQDLNASSVSLGGLDASGVALQSINLEEADLRGADLSNANLSNANLSKANLSGAKLSGANLNRTNLSGANLDSADLSNANIFNVKFCNASLRNAYFDNSYCYYANFNNANLNLASFVGANLNSAVLSNANLKDADLNNASFNEATLTINQVKSAKNWQEAAYDEDFRKHLGL
jgi:BTB/POZ domain-containing protein KCTD9